MTVKKRSITKNLSRGRPFGWRKPNAMRMAFALRFTQAQWDQIIEESIRLGVSC